jgi:hypothetical protein
MITNTIVTRFSCNCPSVKYPAWAEPANEKTYGNSGGNVSDVIKVFIANSPAVSVGDYLCKGEVKFDLTPENLQEFIANIPHYKVTKTALFTLPDGTFHHVEILAEQEHSFA